jgi:hypothetical protein
LFLHDPNCHCFDPTQDLVLNKNAWVDAAPGQFSTSAPYYNDYCWQRQPAESLSLGRTFGLAKEDRVKLDIRAEFFNVFNRLFLSSPAGVGQTTQPGSAPNINPAATVTKTGGILSSGFGVVNTFNVTLTGQIPGNGSQPRTGQIVARVSF